MSFANNTTGFIATSEGVYKTVDVGETWTLNYTSGFLILLRMIPELIFTILLLLNLKVKV